MKKIAIATTLLAVLGVWSEADAANYGTAASAMPNTSNILGWQNICRDRIITRRIDDRHQITYQVPLCNMVWIGKRYFHNGRYYADPNFVVPIQ